MEVTSVSPSATSPTEGDDLCEIDVTKVAIHSVTLLISLCGLVGNGAVLWLLSLKICNILIFNLALTDFVFLLFTVPSALLFLVEDVSCYSVSSLLYLSFLFQLSLVSYTMLFLWMMFTPSFVTVFWFCIRFRYNIPERVLWLLVYVQCWAAIAVFTVITMVKFLCPSQQQEQCRVDLISVYSTMLFICAASMVICPTMGFIEATRGSREHQPKRRDIITFLMVFFTLLLSLFNFLQHLGYTFVSSQVVFLLNCIQSSIKPFIYFLAGRCWRGWSLAPLRLSLQRVFD